MFYLKKQQCQETSLVICKQNKAFNLRITFLPKL